MRVLRAFARVDTLLATLGGLVAVVAVLVAAVNENDGGDAAGYAKAMVIAYVAAIVVGQALPVSLAGDRETAPITSAATLAFAMTVTGREDEVLSTENVIALTALAMAAGLLLRRLRGGRPDLAAEAVRLLGVVVGAVIFHQLVALDGRLLNDQGDLGRAPLAAVMVAVSMAALLVQTTLSAVLRSSRTHAPFRRTFVDEVTAGAGLSTALSATGTLIAIAAEPMQAAAVPLFLLPLVMTQFAVRRQTTIRSTYGQTVRSLSRLTELGGYTIPGHADRVASLSMAMGTDLGLSERDVRDLEYAALLHDIGQVSLTEPIPGGATVLAAPADQRGIASDGAEIVRQTGVLDAVAHIIESQTMPYRQVREFGQDLPMASRIIKVVNAFDDYTGGSGTAPKRDYAVERIQLGLGYEYDPRVVDSLVRVLSRRGG